MPRPASTFLLFFAPLAPLALVLAAACTGVTGVTPDCTSDLGCTGFATCVDKDNKAANPLTCCKDANGAAFTGRQLETCLFAYGVGQASTSGTGSTGGGGK